MKKLLLLSIITLGLSNLASAQYADLAGAVASINTVLTKAPAPCSFQVAPNGEAKKQDSEYTDVVYTFNLNNVELIQYEQEGPSHRVKFVCASGNKCFHCDKNAGAGVVHFLEVDSKGDADEIIKAFQFIKQKIAF